MDIPVNIVGAGLAGSECALQLAARGIDVRLYEMRPHKSSPAHVTDQLAELVCSNSFKSQRPDSAAGLLKYELRAMGSQLIKIADSCSVAAGAALAVNRELFSHEVTRQIEAHSHIELIREEVGKLPQGKTIIACGPLPSEALAHELAQLVGEHSLSFYDAAAPIVDALSIDMNRAFKASRYQAGEGDYLNCAMDRELYEAFVAELLAAKRTITHDFERKELFMACQPVEEIARTGLDSLRFGPLKPVGITDPATGKRPWAVVQLRAENSACTAYNLVGFQTNLTWPEQERIFRMIPGLEEADFLRFGVMHQNTFVDAPRVLDSSFKVPNSDVRLAGQICGTEGYTEAIASGLFAALNCYAELKGYDLPKLPTESAFGSLVAYATNPQTNPYQPMHVNFGLVPSLDGKRLSKRDRYEAYAKRGQAAVMSFMHEHSELFPNTLKD